MKIIIYQNGRGNKPKFKQKREEAQVSTLDQ